MLNDDEESRISLLRNSASGKLIDSTDCFLKLIKEQSVRNDYNLFYEDNSNYLLSLVDYDAVDSDVLFSIIANLLLYNLIDERTNLSKAIDFFIKKGKHDELFFIIDNVYNKDINLVIEKTNGLCLTSTVIFSQPRILDRILSNYGKDLLKIKVHPKNGTLDDSGVAFISFFLLNANNEGASLRNWSNYRNTVKNFLDVICKCDKGIFNNVDDSGMPFHIMPILGYKNSFHEAIELSEMILDKFDVDVNMKYKDLDSYSFSCLILAVSRQQKGFNSYLKENGLLTSKCNLRSVHDVNLDLLNFSNIKHIIDNFCDKETIKTLGFILEEKNKLIISDIVNNNKSENNRPAFKL